MIFDKRGLLTAMLIISSICCQAQQVSLIKSNTGNKRQAAREAPIINLETGQRLTMEQYGALSKADPYAYHLVPVYNEYGQPSGYTMRQATPEEHETHRFRDRDPAKQPKAGQDIAPFVMTGLDGKVYRSSDLLGKVVILSFLVSLDKAFWTDQQNDELTNSLKPYQAKIIGLGVLNSEQAKLQTPQKANPWPFVPIPDAYGFHNKYHITSVPTFVVLDRNGKVAANIQGTENSVKLKQVLETVMK